MSDEDRGLLGGLPRTRPSVESPRRAASRGGPTEGGSRTVGREPIAEPAERDESGFEQLARAGVGAAAGVAAVGVRMAGQAAGLIGKALGRR
jgi:nucleoid-associated protein YgaU